MAEFFDDFQRTSPAGPGTGTGGQPDVAMGNKWLHWNAGGTTGVVIFDGMMTQFEIFSFHTAAYCRNTDASAFKTDGDDQAIRFLIRDFDTQIRVCLRAHDDVVTTTGLLDPDAETTNGQVTMRIQMDQGTAGQITMISEGVYQGPTEITGPRDHMPHVGEARIIGDEVSLLIDGVEVFSRDDMGTLLAGSTRRNIGVCWEGGSEQQYFGFVKAGDHPLSAGPDPDTMPELFAAGAIFAAATGTSITPVIPAGDVADDILIFQAWCNASSTFTTPTDWTEFTSTAVDSANMSAAWFWKRASGSDGNPTSTTSATGSATIGLYGRIWTYRRCIATGTPFEDATVEGTPTLSTTPQTASIDTTGTDRLAVCLVSVDDDNTLTGFPGGWLEHGGRVASTTGGDGMSNGIQRWMPTSGNVAAVTVGTMASDYWRTLTFALIPPSSAITGTVAVTLAAFTAAASGTVTAPFTPADIDGVSLRAWYDASDTATITGSPVSALADKSSNNLDLAQGTVGRRPGTGAVTLNGLNVLTFDGGDDLIAAAVADWKFLHDGTPHLIVAVVKFGTVADPNAVYGLCGTNAASSATNHGTAVFFDDRVTQSRNEVLSHLVARGSGGATINSATPNSWCTPNLWKIVTVFADPANVTAANRSSICVNGGLDHSGNALTGTPSASNPSFVFAVGSCGNFAIPAVMHLAEVVITDDVDDIDMLHPYLSTKWGLGVPFHLDIAGPAVVVAS